MWGRAQGRLWSRYVELVINHGCHAANWMLFCRSWQPKPNIGSGPGFSSPGTERLHHRREDFRRLSNKLHRSVQLCSELSGSWTRDSTGFLTAAPLPSENRIVALLPPE